MLKRVQRPSPALAVSTLALFVALGGTGYAAATINGKNIKNGTVTGKKLKNKTVTGAKIKNKTITGGKVKSNTLTGTQINESSLGTVPAAALADSAKSADVASSLAGQVSYYKRLNLGESAVIATNGPVSLIAECGVDGGSERIRVLASTTVTGAAMDGDSSYTGEPGSTLEPGTPADDRVIVSSSDTAGDPYVTNDIDEGFVMAPSGEIISVNTEGTVLGLNYAGAKCFVAGVANTFNQ